MSAYPNTSLITVSGILVGSAGGGGGNSSACLYGCGTVFTYVPATKAFAVVYALPKSGLDGYTPFIGSIGPGPTIHAVDNSQVFALSQKAGFTDLASFDYYSVGTGAASGPLYTSGGISYGVLTGGQSVGGGALYTIQAGEIVDLAYFGDSSGSGPEALPYLSPTGALIETTIESGLCTYCGAI